ncbi:MAG: hypothetical protein Q7R86_01455 [bacterium]|nr:hypothetical protein [bacterium]
MTSIYPDRGHSKPAVIAVSAIADFDATSGGTTIATGRTSYDGGVEDGGSTPVGRSAREV